MLSQKVVPFSGCQASVQPCAPKELRSVGLEADLTATEGGARGIPPRHTQKDVGPNIWARPDPVMLTSKLPITSHL